MWFEVEVVLHTQLYECKIGKKLLVISIYIIKLMVINK